VPAERRSRTAVLGGLIMAAGLGMTAGVVLSDMPYGFIYLTLGVSAFGMGLVFTADQIVAVESAAPGEEASTGAAIELANALGIAAGAGVAGAFVGRFADHLHTGIGLAFVLTIGSALVAAVTARHLTVPATAASPSTPPAAARSGVQDGPGHQVGAEGGEHRQVQEAGG
jgi:hypothetical protein